MIPGSCTRILKFGRICYELQNLLYYKAPILVCKISNSQFRNRFQKLSWAKFNFENRGSISVQNTLNYYDASFTQRILRGTKLHLAVYAVERYIKHFVINTYSIITYISRKDN